VAESDHRIELVFIINGEDFRVEANGHAPLLAAVQRALGESGNTGRGLDEWEVRDIQGVLLDTHRSPLELGLISGARLFLSLRVGAGG